MAILKARVDEKFAKAFARLANANRRSIAEELRIAAERHLESAKPQKEAA